MDQMYYNGLIVVLTTTAKIPYKKSQMPIKGDLAIV